MRTKHLGILIFSCLLLCFQSIAAQTPAPSSNFGIHPKITHFSRNDFKADAQFWTMTRDSEGIYYFGNNDGAMIFDGERWQKVVLPNNSSVRSLITTQTGSIYAGGYNELGIIEKDSLGKFSFRSLLEGLDLKNRKLENLWQVHEFKDHIIYRSFSELVVISGNTATHIASQQAFLLSDIVNNNYYVQDLGNGILQFDPKKMAQHLVFSASDFNNEEIKAFLPLDKEGGLLLVAKSGAIYKGNPATGEIELWKQVFETNYTDQVISAVSYKNSFLLGTLSSKIIILTQDGELKYDSPAFANMQNSSVLNLYRDGEHIWALLNNGLDFLEFNTPVAHIFKDASIYDIQISENKLFLATNKGVFTSEFNGKALETQNFTFEKIPNLEGQAWSLNKEGKDVIVGHDKGLFLLENKVPKKIGNADGFWKVLKIRDAENKYLAANYNGLYLLTKEKGEWQLLHQLKGFEESTRDILQADQENTFWVCHGYKGVYKLKINNDYTRVYAVEHYTNQNGLESPFNVNVTRWEDNIIFTTNTGIYQFQETSNQFVPYERLNQVLSPEFNTRKLVKDENRVWVVQDDEIGYFNSKVDQPKINKKLFLNLKGSLNRGMEAIQPLQDGKVLVGATTGLFLYDTQFQPRKQIPTTITTASFINGEEEIQLPLNHSGEASLSSTMDILRFEFATPGISPSSSVQYQYRLEGIDNKWSSWDDAPYKEYTHMPAGDYVFKVRSRDLIGNLGEEASFALNISPVWYKTTAAYLICFLVFLFLSLFTIFYIKRKMQRERHKIKLAADMKQKLLELQIEQLNLEKDKETINRDKQLLEEENILKSKELANYTMMLVKKKDVFTETYENLQEFKKTLKTQTARKRLQEVLNTLNQHRIGEEYMTVFDVHFEKVHKNFFQELKAACPDLTKRELRLCAFVKMNLTNKEIAPLLNISVRGVETARYRVRKKLELREINFSDFLETLNQEATELSIP